MSELNQGCCAGHADGADKGAGAGHADGADKGAGVGHADGAGQGAKHGCCAHEAAGAAKAAFVTDGVNVAVPARWAGLCARCWTSVIFRLRACACSLLRVARAAW